MATRIANRFIVEKIPFKKNEEVLYDLPRDRAIRRLTMQLQVQVNAGTTAPSDRTTMHYMNAVKKIRLIRNGIDVKINVDLVSKYFADWAENGVKPTESSVSTPAANASATYRQTVIFDFALSRKVLSDFRALLDAQALSSLQIAVEWGDVGDIFQTAGTAAIDTTNTFFQVSLDEVFDNGARREAGDPGLPALLQSARDIREQVDVAHEITQQRESFDLDEDVVDVTPVPSLVLYEQIRCVKNYGSPDWTHSDDVLTHIKYANIKGGGESIFRARWKDWHNTTKQDLSLDDLPGGVGFLNWVQQRQGGLRNTDPDAIKIKLLTAAPASNKKNAIIVYRKFFAGASRNEA